MTLYLLPGLGADARLFAPLLPHLPATVRAQVLEWLPPAAPDEPLAAYAARLAAPIAPAEACWVAGVSFGGLVALEIGRLRPRARIIQISSLSAAELLPAQFKLMRAAGPAGFAAALELVSGGREVVFRHPGAGNVRAAALLYAADAS